VGDGDAIADQLRTHLQQEIPYLSDICIEMQIKS